MLWAVELRREESRCQLQDLIRPAQLPILRTKLPHFRGFHTRRPRPSARVHLRLSHPVVDGLRRPDPKFRRHRLNGRPLRSMLRPNLRHHPNSTVPQLLRVAPRSSRHDPILPKRRSLRQTRGDSAISTRAQTPPPTNDPTGLGLGDLFEWVGIGMVCASAHVGDTLAAPETLGTAFLVADLTCTGSVVWGLSSYV